MKKHIKNLIGLVTTLLLLISMHSEVNAQTTGEVINETNNLIVLRVESAEQLSTPSKILLVYDSNLITLESTSAKARNYNSRIRNYNMASALVSALSVDFEADIEMEDWMLSPFKPESSDPSVCKIEEEEPELPLEPWMTDLKHWNDTF